MPSASVATFNGGSSKSLFMQIEGVIPPTVTPYDTDGDIDEDRIADLFDFLIDEGGVHGLWFLGSSGDGGLLTLEETKQSIDVAVDHVDGRVPLIAGVGASSTRETLEVAQHAEDAGATAIHVIPPPDFGPLTEAGLLRHFQKINDGVDVPIFIYHIPQRSGFDLSIDLLIDLLQLSNVVGMKDSSKNIEWGYRALERIHGEDIEATYLVGTNRLIYPYLHLGVDGAVSSVANVAPRSFVKLFEEFRNGNFDEAKNIQDELFQLADVIKPGSSVARVRAALKLRGIDCGPMRSPSQDVDDDERHIIEQTVEEFDFV